MVVLAPRCGLRGPDLLFVLTVKSRSLYTLVSLRSRGQEPACIRIRRAGDSLLSSLPPCRRSLGRSLRAPLGYYCISWICADRRGTSGLHSLARSGRVGPGGRFCRCICCGVWVALDGRALAPCPAFTRRKPP